MYTAKYHISPILPHWCPQQGSLQGRWKCLHSQMRRRHSWAGGEHINIIYISLLGAFIFIQKWPLFFKLPKPWSILKTQISSKVKFEDPETGNVVRETVEVMIYPKLMSKISVKKSYKIFQGEPDKTWKGKSGEKSQSPLWLPKSWGSGCQNLTRNHRQHHISSKFLSLFTITNLKCIIAIIHHKWYWYWFIIRSQDALPNKMSVAEVSSNVIKCSQM